jgi:kinesin family protein 5
MVSSTKMNINSSRSHSLFIVEVESFDEVGAKLMSAKLILVPHFLNQVDLAGSEKLDPSLNVKVKEESININYSLFNLRYTPSYPSKVINCLSDGGVEGHIPFRDSKLTCLLQQSLGGNGSCLMVITILMAQIGCIVPLDSQFEENMATLSYTYKANRIVNNLTRGEEPGRELIQRLKARVKQLEDELVQSTKQIDTLQKLVESNQTLHDSKGHHNRFQLKNFDGVPDSLMKQLHSKIDNIQQGHSGRGSIDTASTAPSQDRVNLL